MLNLTSPPASSRAPTPPAPSQPDAVEAAPGQPVLVHTPLPRRRARLYVSVRWKFAISMAAALLWAAFSLMLARVWLAELSTVTGTIAAHLIVFGIAIVPGFMNAFLLASLLMDRRPVVRASAATLPGITILIAAYNEQDSIASTIDSIERQQYPGPMQVIVINDGSTDGTADALATLSHPWLEVISLPKNAGKAAALNTGLARARFGLTLTVDGDCYLYRDALRNLVGRYLSDPQDTRAVAGAMLVRNSRHNLVTATQEWDYFHGIAAIKRLQSLYHGTLVAQGAFSAYDTATLRQLGGWPHTVGEDIVVTWAILERGWRVGFAENACAFTNVPTTWKQFIRQRQRWSRGLIEAFKSHWRLLFKARPSTMFVWWNALFPYLDLVYSLVFVPGLILALFGHYYVAGPMTLIVLPLAMLVNFIMYQIQNGMFREQGLKVRRNVFGFVAYALLYSIVLQPACVVGYVKEIVLRTKNWGTK